MLSSQSIKEGQEEEEEEEGGANNLDDDDMGNKSRNNQHVLFNFYFHSWEAYITQRASR